MNRHFLPTLCTLAFAALPAMAQTALDACQRVDDKDRLACYDWALEREPPKPPAGVVELKEVKDAFMPPDKASRRFFVRKSTALSESSAAPAELSLERSAGKTIGSTQGALLWVEGGRIDMYDDEAHKGPVAYAGLGAAIDRTGDAEGDSSTRDARLGIRWAWRTRADNTSGLAAMGDFSAQRLRNLIEDTRRDSADFDNEVQWRELRLDKFGRSEFDNRAYAGLKLFHDSEKSLRDGAKRSSHGVVLRLGAEADLPPYRCDDPARQAWKCRLESLTWLVPSAVAWQSSRTRELNAERRQESRHSISASWDLARRGQTKLGLKVERSLGSDFRAGEPKAGVLNVKLTASY